MRKKPMLLSTKEAAVKLKITQQYLRDLLHDRIIKGVMIGNAYVIDPDEKTFRNFQRKRRQKRTVKNA